MCYLSNTLISILNLGTLGISMILIFISFSFHSQDASACQDFIRQPLLIIGVFLLVMSVFALVGSCCRIPSLLWLYLFVLLLLMIGLFCFTIFSFIVTYKGSGREVPNKEYKEYELDDYSSWLKKNVVNDKHWGKIKSCLSDSKFCSKLAKARNGTPNPVDTKRGASEFYKIRLTSTQSGCCKPPSVCGFEFQNATFWTKPKIGQITQADDCRAWSNNQTELCFNCSSCKAGVLDNIKREWKQLSIILSCILVFLNIVYAVGCCALDNTRAYKYYRHRGYP